MSQPSDTTSAVETLKTFDSCTISNAIERLNVRMRNEGFASGDIQCRFPELPPTVAYAATARIRTASPPMSHRCYYDRMDWWSYVATLPQPRVLVLQDCDPRPGVGAFVGEIHASIGRALSCVGCITDGAVRDLPPLRAIGFQLFAAHLSVSHAYAHIVEFGEPVEIDGLKIASGDLLHGDCHGVVSIPRSIVAELPGIAATVRQEEHELIEFCRSTGFSLQALTQRLQKSNVGCDLPWRRVE